MLPLSGHGALDKPSVKPAAAQRESEGVVVPPMPVHQNAGGGKGPCDGHVCEAGKREGMASESPPNHLVRPSSDAKVRELRSKLGASAKRSPGRRFHALYDRIYRSDVLWMAWEQVRRNKGAAGVDFITLADIERYGSGTGSCRRRASSSSNRSSRRTWGHLVRSRVGDRPIDARVLDGRFLHLIRAVALVWRIDAAGADRVESLKTPAAALWSTPEPTLAVLDETGCLENAFVDYLVRALDLLARAKGGGAEVLGREDFVDENDTLNRVFEPVQKQDRDGLTRRHFVEFAAWLMFLLDRPADLGSAPHRAALHEWTRVVSNLACNSELGSDVELVRAVRGLRALRPAAVAGALLPLVAQDDAQSGFNRQQRREEALKARLLLREPAWREPIEDAERHAYLDGHIGFLLEFAELLARGSGPETCSWSDDEDAALRSSLGGWLDRFLAVFPAGSSRGPLDLDRAVTTAWLWERAVLAQGDWLRAGWGTRSLRRDKPAREWKDLLRDDGPLPDGRPPRALVGDVLGRVDPHDVEGSLQRIVEGGALGLDEVPVEPWRALLVSDQRFLADCRFGLLRFDDDTVYILARRSRGTTYHGLFRGDLAFRLEARGDLDPLEQVKYEPGTGLVGVPRLRLRGRGVRLDVRIMAAGACSWGCQASGSSPTSSPSRRGRRSGPVATSGSSPARKPSGRLSPSRGPCLRAADCPTACAASRAGSPPRSSYPAGRASAPTSFGPSSIERATRGSEPRGRRFLRGTRRYRPPMSRSDANPLALRVVGNLLDGAVARGESRTLQLRVDGNDHMMDPAVVPRADDGEG